MRGLDHGSFVASRAVFGDISEQDELPENGDNCSFYDVIIAEGYINRIVTTQAKFTNSWATYSAAVYIR